MTDLGTTASLQLLSLLLSIGVRMGDVWSWTLTVGIVGLIAAAMIWFIWQVVVRYKSAHKDVVQLQAIVDDRNAGRGELRHLVEESASKNVQLAWHEYDESLVQTPSADVVYATADAEYFFNTRSLAPRLIHDRLLSYLPSAMTAIGVLGTFLGLTIGLSGLDFSDSTDVDSLRQGINQLIGGASVAFFTSIAGVFASLMTNSQHKIYERKFESELKGLQNSVDRRFMRYSPERSFLQISGHTQESAEALAELHEKIGSKLQTAVEGISRDMQDAVATAIKSSIAPELQKLAESTSKQSSELFENLIGRFGASFSELGASQAQAMQAASSGIADALSSMAGQVSAMVNQVQEEAERNRQDGAQRLQEMQTATEERTAAFNQAASEQIMELQRVASEQTAELRRAADEQAAQFREAAAEQNEAFQREMQGLVALSGSQREQMENTVTGLTSMVETLRAAMDSTTTDLRSVTTSFESISRDFTRNSTEVSTLVDSVSAHLGQVMERQESSLELFAKHSKEIRELHDMSSSAASHLAKSAEKATHGFDQMSTRQSEFLSGLKAHLTSLNSGLREEVEGLVDQMSQWLQEYSNSVTEHTERRMDEWNKQSQDYASNMVSVASSLAAVIDEIEGKQTRAGISS